MNGWLDERMDRWIEGRKGTRRSYPYELVKNGTLTWAKERGTGFCIMSTPLKMTLKQPKQKCTATVNLTSLQGHDALRQTIPVRYAFIRVSLNKPL